jgi:hypothetical protein
VREGTREVKGEVKKEGVVQGRRRTRVKVLGTG